MLPTARRAATTSAAVLCFSNHHQNPALSRMSFRQAPLLQAWQDIWDVLAIGCEMCAQHHPVIPCRAKREGAGKEGK